MIKPKIKIAVTICTRRRPLQLDAALAAATAIQATPNTEVFVIVVENDSSPTVDHLIEKWNGRIRVHYFLEMKRGISVARNRSIDEALKLGADWISTSDDDGEMAFDCIAKYIDVSRKYPNSRLFVGRTRYSYPESMPTWYPKTYRGPSPTGSKPIVYSTSNSFFHRSIVDNTGLNLRFDPAFSLSGGEDYDFFIRASKLAGQVIWVEEAVVNEKLIQSRANLGFIFRKQLRNGQNRARVLRKNNSMIVAFLMVVHASYRSFVFGIVSILSGAAQLLFNENAGLTRVFAGLIHLTLIPGMLGSYFRPAVEWYKKTDGH